MTVGELLLQTFRQALDLYHERHEGNGATLTSRPVEIDDPDIICPKRKLRVTLKITIEDGETRG